MIDRARRHSLPLARKLPLLILGVLALVLALGLGISYYTVRRAALQSAVERLASTASVLSSMIQQQIASRIVTMHRVAADTAVIDALRNPARAPSAGLHRALLPLDQRADSLTPAEVVTADFQTIGKMRLEIPSEARLNALRALAVAGDTTFVSEILVANGRASFWEAVPVHHDSQLLGFVVQERRLGSNPRTLQPFRDLVGSDIDFYLRNAGDDTWKRLIGEGPEALRVAKPVADGLQLVDLGTRGEALAATAPVSGTPFSITLARPMKSILARPQATLRVLVVIAILLTMLGGVIAWLISRQITRPLVELTRAAEALAEGEYAQRVAARRTDEVGRLGSAFNQMAERVQDASRHSTEAVDQLTRSVATQRFLAEASRMLSMSLSDTTLLTDLVRFCVPTLADYCSIHISSEDGTLRRVETAHRDPAKQDALRALLARFQYRVDGPGEVPEVIRTQQPLVIPRLDLAVSNPTADEEIRELLDEIGPRAFMCVPLVARGRPLGAMSFTMTDADRTFGPADLDLAMELARRAAVAVDNALIYRRSLALRIEAEQASMAKSDFLAKMSHEIRTPINAMMGYAQIIEMGISGPVTAAQTQQLDRIRASGEHLTALVNEILDLAKIEAGRMGVANTNGNAGDVTEAALALIRPQAASRGIELIGRIADGPAVGYAGDPQRVQQIITNLLSNAVKFTPQGGRVTVGSCVAKRPDLPEIDRARDWACIVVEDNGIGIAPHDLERVFEPFVQVDGGYTRSHGGTGLGLTISRGLAQTMGGEITVESTPGQGSCFALWLPVARFMHT